MRRRMTGLGGAGLLVLLAAGWVLLAPVQLGGQATYLTTDGTSMLPAYHTGDLVVLRRAAEYQVGDVVAYLDPHIGRVWVHVPALGSALMTAPSRRSRPGSSTGPPCSRS